MTEVKHELAQLEGESNAVLDKAQRFTIKSQADYDAAAQFIKGIKALQKKVSDTFTPIVQKAHAAWKEAKDQENKHLVPLKSAEEIVKRASLTWYDEQEKKRLDDERKAREEADAKAKKEKEKLEARAQKAEAKGDTEKAEDLRDQAQTVQVPAAPVEPTAKVAEGQSIREVWKAELLDLEALVKAVAAGRAPISFLQADMVAINKQAKATKDTMKFDGIRFFAEKQMAVK